jgi:hypothetical protein
MGTAGAEEVERMKGRTEPKPSRFYDAADCEAGFQAKQASRPTLSRLKALYGGGPVHREIHLQFWFFIL